MITYAQALAINHPGIKLLAFGDGTNYDTIITSADFSLPSKSTLDAECLALTKALVWKRIQAERDRRKSTGGYQVGAHWYHSDDTSRIQQLGLVMMGANLPSNIMWKTMGGEFVQMAPTLALQIFAAAAASDTAIFTVAEQLKAQVNSMTTDPEQFNYLTGTPSWPKIYGE